MQSQGESVRRLDINSYELIRFRMNFFVIFGQTPSACINCILEAFLNLAANAEFKVQRLGYCLVVIFYLEECCYIYIRPVFSNNTYFYSCSKYFLVIYTHYFYEKKSFCNALCKLIDYLLTYQRFAQ